MILLPISCLCNLLAIGKRSASVHPMKTQIKIREAKQNSNEAICYALCICDADDVLIGVILIAKFMKVIIIVPQPMYCNTA
jgi:hypothetical protein